MRMGTSSRFDFAGGLVGIERYRTTTRFNTAYAFLVTVTRDADVLGKSIVIVAMISLLFPLTAHAQSVVGAWELVSIDPLPVSETSPYGVRNTKLVFTADGSVTSLDPVEVVDETTKFSKYVVEGTTLILGEGKAEQRLDIVALDEGNLILERRESQPQYVKRNFRMRRYFRRLLNSDMLLEPKSLQIIQTNLSVTPPAYDSTDYSSLASAKRILGLWEVIEYRRVSTYQIPPYGFTNDLWTFQDGKVSVVLRIANDLKTEGSWSIEGNSLTLVGGAGGIAVAGERVTGITMKMSYDQWGHLVLDFGPAEFVLRLVTKNLSAPPSVPVQIVVLKRSR